MKVDKSDDIWKQWWEARVAAIETVLGKAETIVGHAPFPFYLGGPETPAAADIIYFRHHVPGVVSVTSELIECDELGCKKQVPNKQGNYELAVSHRDDEDWGPNLISRLAHDTLERALDPGDTMDMESAVPEKSTIAALLFFDYGRFKVRGRKSGLLLCMGITADELKACREGRRPEVEKALKNAGIYPYTDLFRKSVLK